MTTWDSNTVFLPLPRNPQFIDRTGGKFGRLTAIGYMGKNRFRTALWACLCDCGNRPIVRGVSLADGHSTSCGCFHSEVRAVAGLIHGLSKTPEYKVWIGMRARCANEMLDYYKNYGGRGISVCEQWLNSFEQFYADMGPRPSSGHSIERVDNDGNYEPANCIWATKTEQQNNRRANHMLTLDGKTQTMTKWARELGVKFDQIKHRLSKGWSDTDALTIPFN